jgi:uncharacterized membrane protein HdeD (DUF308 family)
MVDVLARNWWALVLRGIAAIVFGLLAFFIPGVALFVLVILFGAYSLVDGVLAVVAAFRAAQTHTRWMSFALEGLVGIAVGLVTFFWPHITALALVYVIAFWAIVTGIFELVAALQLRKHIQNEWLLILGGILSIVFGVWISFEPGGGALAVVWIIAWYAILFGVLLVGLGLRLRGHAARAA